MHQCQWPGPVLLLQWVRTWPGWCHLPRWVLNSNILKLKLYFGLDFKLLYHCFLQYNITFYFQSLAISTVLLLVLPLQYPTTWYVILINTGWWYGSYSFFMSRAGFMLVLYTILTIMQRYHEMCWFSHLIDWLIDPLCRYLWIYTKYVISLVIDSFTDWLVDLLID